MNESRYSVTTLPHDSAWRWVQSRVPLNLGCARVEPGQLNLRITLTTAKLGWADGTIMTRSVGGEWGFLRVLEVSVFAMALSKGFVSGFCFCVLRVRRGVRVPALKIPTRFLNGNPDLGWGRACPYIRGASISSLYISRLLAYI